MSTSGNSTSTWPGHFARNGETPPAWLISSTRKCCAAGDAENSANVPAPPNCRSSAVASAMQRSVLPQREHCNPCCRFT